MLAAASRAYYSVKHHSSAESHPTYTLCIRAVTNQNKASFGIEQRPTFSTMQRINTWAQVTAWVSFIISILGNLTRRISCNVVILSDRGAAVYRSIWPSRTIDTPVYRPLFTPRDILDKFLGLPFLFTSDQWRLPLEEQMVYLNAALDRNVQRVRVQQRQLDELLCELDQSHLTNQELRAKSEQLQSSLLGQEAIVSARNFLLKDQKISLERAEQRIVILDRQKAVLQRQTQGLASKMMAQQRHLFSARLQTRKLEQEKFSQQVLMREMASIKTIVRDNLQATSDLGRFTRNVLGEGVYTKKNLSQVSINTYSLFSSSDDASSLPRHRRFLDESPVITSGRSSQISLANSNGTIRSRAESDRAAQMELCVRSRIMEIVDVGLSGCRERGWFYDDFDPEDGESEVVSMEDSTTGIQAVMALVYDRGT